ncbi:MAG: hypothetical protein BLM47_12925 [Candidatus Reconcilbacillus cellulovorans]|uniref:DUF86 domain-containing protein n=1 Tax=Candidatus Reconcilbacillus cellulovorans TaxID=1906605 RepID=A0A2A6DXB1_9BACL|nr:MAG: hypothetical protein BLM47_12925 [Candidatus Reconcilbacillus cellulovorans]
MYRIDRERLERLLDFLSVVAEGCRALAAEAPPADEALRLIRSLAQERLLHLAAEAVTDIGGILIDGFLMRDAAGYEDIVEVLKGEGVVGEAEAAFWIDLIRLRRELVRDYASIVRDGRLHPLVSRLPAELESFAADVRAFLRKELG